MGDEFDDVDPDYEENDWGCLFSEKCLMPNPYHLRSECHTAEMMEDMFDAIPED